MGPNKTDSIVERDGDEFLEGRDLTMFMMALMMLLMKMKLEKNLRMKIIKKNHLAEGLGEGR